MAISNKGYILCIPQGGLNDKLTQIEQCCKYAENYGREVVVDTKRESISSFHDEFINYFSPKESNLHFSAKKFYSKFCNFDIYPKQLQQSLNSYIAQQDKLTGKRVDVGSGQVISFNFSIQYDEYVLVHDQYGGIAEEAVMALRRMELREHLVEALLGRLRVLGSNYLAIHIRNTDLNTNYMKFLDDEVINHYEKVFISSDDSNVIAAYKKAYGSKIFSFSSIPNRNGLPIHVNHKLLNFRKINSESILDLLTLGLSNKLRYYKVSNNPYGDHSGYSRLSGLLHEDKRVIFGIMGKNRDKFEAWLS